MDRPDLALIVLAHGSPRSADRGDVAKYLKRFLSDKRVITLPFLLRRILVDCIIVPFRAKKSAEHYRLLSTNCNGRFPLDAYTESISRQLAELTNLPTAFAMRYGTPGAEEVFAQMERDVRPQRYLLLPLYPHYAMSSYETLVCRAFSQARKLGITPDRLHIMEPYYDNEVYVAALVQNIQTALSGKSVDRLLVSMHGIPLAHVAKTPKRLLGISHSDDCCSVDSPAAAVCYRYQCEVTARLLARALQRESYSVELVYQSRMGHTAWMQPYLGKRIRELPAEGAKHIAVVCPGFPVDCLETLEEINMRERAAFLKAGGEDFTYVPCLNDAPDWLSRFAEIALTGLRADKHNNIQTLIRRSCAGR